MVYIHPATGAVLDTIARRVRARRKQLGWSQETLASEMGSEAKQVSRVECGKNMTILTLTRVAAGLGVEPGELLPDGEVRRDDPAKVGPPIRLALVGRVSPWNPPGRQGRPAKLSIAPTGDRGTLVAFGARVRWRREDLGWSQRQLAKWLDTDSSYVARIERGHLAVRISMLIRLAEALELDPGDLLDARAIAPRARAATHRLRVVGVAGDGIGAPTSLAPIGIYTNT